MNLLEQEEKEDAVKHSVKTLFSSVVGGLSITALNAVEDSLVCCLWVNGCLGNDDHPFVWPGLSSVRWDLGTFSVSLQGLRAFVTFCLALISF